MQNLNKGMTTLYVVEDWDECKAMGFYNLKEAQLYAIEIWRKTVSEWVNDSATVEDFWKLIKNDISDLLTYNCIEGICDITEIPMKGN